MATAQSSKDTVTAYYQAQAKHGRQLESLLGKGVNKWKAKDFAAIQATRSERDAAVAALTHAQKLQHVDGLSRTEAEGRSSQVRPIASESAEGI